MTFWKWSQTAASNNTADSTVNWREGQAPSTVNDSARAMMAAAAKFRDDINGGLTTGGTLTAYTVTTNQGFTSLIDGMRLKVRLHAANGVNATFAPDGLTAKALTLDGTNAPPAGYLLIGSIYDFTYRSAVDKWIVGSAFSTPFNSSGQLLLADGTAPLPGIAFTSDLDTGMYRIGADQLGFTLGGTQRLSLTGTNLFTNNISMGTSGGATLTMGGTGNNQIEIGRTDGISSSPFIDFHSGATSVDFDSRIIASGGTGSSGGGTLSMTAGQIAMTAASGLLVNGLAVGGLRGIQAFGAGSGNYTRSSGVSRILAFATGAGGGGATGSSNSGGGGAGATGISVFDVSASGPIAYSVGAAVTPANNGGNTTFNGITAGGGATGAGSTPGAGGNSSGAQVNLPGGDGQQGGGGGNQPKGTGGASFWGGGGMGGNATAARVFGSGGGGNDGNSAQGLLMIIEFGA